MPNMYYNNGLTYNEKGDLLFWHPLFVGISEAAMNRTAEGSLGYYTWGIMFSFEGKNTTTPYRAYAFHTDTFSQSPTFGQYKYIPIKPADDLPVDQVDPDAWVDYGDEAGDDRENFSWAIASPPNTGRYKMTVVDDPPADRGTTSTRFFDPYRTSGLIQDAGFPGSGSAGMQGAWGYHPVDKPTAAVLAYTALCVSTPDYTTHVIPDGGFAKMKQDITITRVDLATPVSKTISLFQNVYNTTNTGGLDTGDGGGDNNNGDFDPINIGFPGVPE